MAGWLIAAGLSLLCFGMWAFLTKVASFYVDAKSGFFFQAIGVFLMGIVTLHLLKYKPDLNLKGFYFSMLAGVLNGAGCLLFLYASGKGKVSTVVTLTSLYPVIAIALAFFVLHETIALKQYFGILCGLAAVCLLV